MAKRAKKKAAKKTPAQTPREKLRELVKDYRRTIAIGANCYKKADELFAEIRKRLKPGVRIPLHGTGEPLWAVIVDRFDDEDKVFQPVPMKRYELQIQDASGRSVRMRDRYKKKGKK